MSIEKKFEWLASRPVNSFSLNIFRRYFGLCWHGKCIPAHVHKTWVLGVALAVTVALVYFRVDSLAEDRAQFLGKVLYAKKSEAVLSALLNKNLVIIENTGVLCESIDVKLR